MALLVAPASAGAQSRSLYWGAWIGPQLTGEEAPWDMEAARQFEVRIGRGLSLIEFSAPFAQCGVNCHFNPFPLTPLEKIRAHGAIPLFSWNSGAGGGGDHSKFGLAELRAGRYDRYIRYFARNAAAWGWPFFLRFNWEMNGSWFPWGAGTNGNQPGASTGTDEQKSLWIQEMFTALRDGYPKVRALVWFNKIDRETQWPVETLPGASAAFGEGLAQGFKQNVYSHLKRSPIPPPARLTNRR
jgi:hypothetical protein